MSADQLTRRDALRLGALSAMAFSLRASPALAAALARPRGRADACIVIWLDGGPSHIDTFDPKPEAQAEIRGEFGAIDTSLDGVRICEHLPQIASRLHRTALVRSLTSLEGNHDRGSHHYLTGFHPSPSLVYPSMGSVLAREVGEGSGGVPTYVALGKQPQYGGAGYLGRRFDPYESQVGQSKGGALAELGRERLLRRRALRERLGEIHGGAPDPDLESFYDQAFDLLTSPKALAAFDVDAEPESSRARFGRIPLGDACLTARRLVEAGSRFVTVRHDGWDTHENNFYRLTFGYPGPLPSIDLAFSALLDDLDERGLLERTMVVMMGEFGRTPKVNAKAGRDHWPRANWSLLAGGGLRTGQAIGATDARGELPIERPLAPERLVATIYHQLGVSMATTYRTPDGRPIRVLPEAVEPIMELL